MTKFIKILALFLTVICFFIVSILNYIVIFFNKNLWRKSQVYVNHLSCLVVKKILGIRISISYNDLKKEDLKNASYIVSNHLSYLDIIIIYSIFYPNFVANIDLKSDYFIKSIFSLCACFFTRRKISKKLLEEILIVKDYVFKDNTIILFPEATSGNGEQVLHFHSAFFQPAIEKKDIKILPVCLNYTKIDNKSLNLENKEILFWHRDTTASLLSHLNGVLNLKIIDIQLEFLKPLVSQNFKCRKNLTKHCELLIKNKFICFTR